MTGAVVLLAVAGCCWAISAARMDGMDAGPRSDVGATGWFIATWIVMMAAMMVPVVTPAVVDQELSRCNRALLARACGAVTFVGAYLAVWAAAGLLVYELLSLVDRVAGNAFAWDHAGRWASIAVLGAAAAYQLSARKRRAIERCRRTAWSGGPAALAGFWSGLNCLSSSWAMMASLFALGVMSLWWMAIVAGLIAAERLPRASAPGRIAGALIFIALALGVAVAPDSVPGLTVPGSPAAMRAMRHMSSGARMTGGAMKRSSSPERSMN